MEVAAPATAALGRRDAAVEVLQMNGAESTSASARRYNETLAKARAAGDLTYRCLSAAPIRATVDASSSQLGTLKAHETFRAVREIVKDGHRVLEMDRGWVDMAAKSGKPIVVLEAAVQTFLTTVPLLQNLTQTERDQVAKVLDAEDFQMGFPIGREGDRGDAMYFLEEGKAEATIANAQGKAELVRHYARGDFFGDMALLTDSPRTETVTAGRTGDRGQEGARMLKLSAKVFNEFAARCPAILEVQRQEYAKAHVVDISDAALESYLGRHDLFGKIAMLSRFVALPSLSLESLLQTPSSPTAQGSLPSRPRPARCGRCVRSSPGRRRGSRSRTATTSRSGGGSRTTSSPRKWSATIWICSSASGSPRSAASPRRPSPKHFQPFGLSPGD